MGGAGSFNLSSLDYIGKYQRLDPDSKTILPLSHVRLTLLSCTCLHAVVLFPFSYYKTGCAFLCHSLQLSRWPQTASKSFGGLHGLLYGNVPDSLTFSLSEVLCEKEVIESGLRDYLKLACLERKSTR